MIPAEGAKDIRFDAAAFIVSDASNSSMVVALTIGVFMFTVAVKLAAVMLDAVVMAAFFTDSSPPMSVLLWNPKASIGR